jgi:hypothetical protein
MAAPPLVQGVGPALDSNSTPPSGDCDPNTITPESMPQVRADMLIVNRMPSALRLSMRIPRKLMDSSVDIARITSGPLELVASPCGIPDLSS